MPYLVLIYAVIIVAVAIDIVVADGRTVRGLPKMVWVLGAMVLPLLGPIAWFALGRPSKDDGDDEGAPPREGRPSRPSTKPAVAPARSAADDARAEEEFRRTVRERAEAQRRAAREQRGPDV